MADDDGTAAANATTADELARLRAENDNLRSRLQMRARIRKTVSVVLVFLSILLVIASTVAVWSYRTALNTDRFMDSVEPALEDPALYDALSEVVYTQVIDALDLETRVANRLAQVDEYLSETLTEAIDIDERGQALLSRVDRPSLEALAPAIASALEERVQRIVDRVVTSDAIRQRLPELVRQVHEAAVALLRGNTADLPNVYTADGEVLLNLVPIIADVLRQVVDEIREFLPDVDLPDVVATAAGAGRQQLAEALHAQLPEDFGQVTLMSEDALGEAQQALNRLDRYVWVIVLITVAVLALTIATAVSRRRIILILGGGIILGLILGAVVIRRLRRAVLEEIDSANGERAAAVFLNETIGSLRNVALIIGAVALIALVAAHLTGRPTWATRVSERGAAITDRTDGPSRLDMWVGAHYDVARIVGIVVAVGIVFVVGIHLVPLIIVAALLALYLWALADAKNHAAAEPSTTATASEPANHH